MLERTAKDGSRGCVAQTRLERLHPLLVLVSVA